MDKATVTIHFVDAAVQGLRDHGLDPAPLLAKAGIAPAWLNQPGQRVPVAAYSRMLRLIAQVLDDEFFGMDRRRMKVGSFAMLCHSAVHCPTLGAALQRVARFYGLMLDDVGLALESGDGLARLVIYPRDPARPPRRFAYETLLVFLRGLACWLIDRRLAVQRAEFAYAAPPWRDEYLVLYSEILRFDCPRTCLVFDAAALALPVQQTERSLKPFLAAAPENILVRYKNLANVSSRVRRMLRHRAPADWPDFDTVARELRRAPATLRRQLRADGQSYRSLKDNARCDLALVALKDPGRSIADIAGDLGFAEPSAFQRAFKKWTGEAPGEYRRRAAGIPRSPLDPPDEATAGEW